LSDALQRLTGSTHPALASALERAGRVRDRLDHPQLRDARRLLRATSPGGADVLLLGESVLSFVGPRDADQRNLPRMVADRLGPSVRLEAVHGGGYHAALLTAYVELIRDRPHLPRVVVVSLWARGRLRPWIEHPRFSHADALARLRRLSPDTPPWRVRGSLRRATGADFDRYYELRHPTLLGDRTIGDYARPLKSGGLDPDERLALLYAFHHGAPVGADELEAVTQLGAALAGLGCRFFAFEAPISVATGERALGPDFRELVTSNLAALGTAFRRGAGSDAVVLATGAAFDEGEFIDPSDGTEHLAAAGRQRLAALLADEVARQLR
jgi:hypothetical protein